MTNLGLVGRSGLAQILGCSESTTRNLERDGEIKAAAVIGNRSLFRVEEARALKIRREADRGAKEAA